MSSACLCQGPDDFNSTWWATKEDSLKAASASGYEDC